MMKETLLCIAALFMAATVSAQSSDGNRLTGLWGDTDYSGQPWVENVSSPLEIDRGLQNRHLALWASHGRYYSQQRGWLWQRPKLFCTNEDLFTQTIVVPYLIPMLENAGAVVFTPRERDWQKNEVIIDNDNSGQDIRYLEVNTRHDWKDAGTTGFAFHQGYYHNGENPFSAGTARMAKTTGKKNKCSIISYQPDIPTDGRYAVYVSYPTVENSIDDAHYTVWHKGVETEFIVNQQMGGSTWVYLGTFDFDKGCNEYNRVTLSNLSDHKGVVTADAVRFGGGMGNIERGGTTSGLPRCLEGARYYTQWAGMDTTVYNGYGGTDDYKDDINSRSLMVNRLGGGSCYMPDREGLHVPIELSLAVHSDAGYAADGDSIIGTLAICTTNYGDSLLGAGVSRLASRQLAEDLFNNTMNDLKQKYGEWNKREIYDRNYSETRLPAVPSAIVETMSHQNFPDMRYGQDPDFKFSLARSLYKTILRYVCDQHGKPYTVTPLTPTNFRVELTGKGVAKLSWTPVDDTQEKTAQATDFIVYTRCGNAGFDNGKLVSSATSTEIALEPGVLYSFCVAACNRGGRSFPSEELCALYNPRASRTVLVVNGFHRLSSPAVVDDSDRQGYDIDSDPGLTLGRTLGWCGRQTNFDRSHIGIEDSTGLGWSGEELAGTFIGGNEQNYVRTHAEAIAAAGTYNIASSSSYALERGSLDADRYELLDIVLGEEKDDGHSLVYYKTFTADLRKALQSYTAHGGALLVSGSHIGSDMKKDDEKQFLANVLKCSWDGDDRHCTDSIRGLGTTFAFHHAINEDHYAAIAPDKLSPVSTAYTAMVYSDGNSACVAYPGNDYRALTLGFPFECIKESSKRKAIMSGLLRFLEN